MPTRREILGALLVMPAGLAFADKRAEIWSGTTIAKAEKGSVVVEGQHVRLRNRATPKELTMLSRSNDNQHFMLWVWLPKQNESDFQYVRVGNDWWSSHGTGGDHEGTKTSFEFDRATALRIAAAFKLTVHERTKLDDGLRYTWRIPPKATMDKTSPIPIVLRVENAGKTAVGFMIGGRQRGPRDNRFTYVISRNGKPVTLKDGPDFGGIGSYHVLEPGKHIDVTCADLRAWADLDMPGYYTIEARYDGELSKDGKFPSTAAERAQLWDIAATGQGSILVQ